MLAAKKISMLEFLLVLEDPMFHNWEKSEGFGHMLTCTHKQCELND